jgi:D-glycero-beta-D-manno-heptose 1-phosphate adenylyltransferase
MSRVTTDKITTREALAPLVAQWRVEGKKVGFTSGAFDIIHAGHIQFLESTKEHCDVLIVGVNTDVSVQEYKGPDRPIVPEAARVTIVAGLESVDYVFTFGERRNRTNIETLKPTYYIKAGDYTKKELTSGDVVGQYGGEVLILPMAEGFSTTNIIKRIAKVYGGKVDESIDESKKASTEKREPQKAVFVDRDGTINEEVEYLHEPEKFQLTPHAAEGLKKMQDLGYKIVVITTQTGIGLGYFTKEDFYKVNQEMFKQLKSFDVTIDKIYFATNAKTPDGKNPKAALIIRGREELDLDLSQCVVIGDKTGDLASGDEFGCTKIAVKTGHGFRDKQHEVTPDFTADNLLVAAEWLETHSPVA